MEIRNAHFPGRAPLDAYGNGGFRFAKMSHHGSILCVPSGIYGWNISDAADFNEDAFQRVFEERSDIEVLLVGTGRDLLPLRPAMKDLFREAGILTDPMSTGAAVRTFNVLLSEDRAVAAALLAVD
ncbi:Mth938-like domain-containing protein [uncultured Roseibium sp.]|uniref:Mth938-like domain-containing protein n=1 Tax=uncultured Roseibium sp. TaxID=1936171 RepID=UPI002637AB62|nr:Mth938-like domain-containing protein [uncultured Roseibium sp.]